MPKFEKQHSIKVVLIFQQLKKNCWQIGNGIINALRNGPIAIDYGKVVLYLRKRQKKFFTIDFSL